MLTTTRGRATVAGLDSSQEYALQVFMLNGTTEKLLAKRRFTSKKHSKALESFAVRGGGLCMHFVFVVCVHTTNLCTHVSKMGTYLSWLSVCLLYLFVRLSSYSDKKHSLCGVVKMVMSFYGKHF